MTSVSTAAPARAGLGSRAVDAVAKWGFVAVTVLLIVFFALTEPAFATVDNVFGMLKYIAPIGIAGLGVTLAMTVGGLDLSVGANAGFAVSIAAWTMVIGNQVGGIAVGVVLISGALIGAVNAALIVFARIPTCSRPSPRCSPSSDSSSSSWTANRSRRR